METTMITDSAAPAPFDAETDLPEGFHATTQYTRKQALEDGVLVDVTPTAREAGIACPVALTRRVWDAYVALSPAALRAGNDEAGRLWDVVWMFRCAAARNPSVSTMRFELHVVTTSRRPSRVQLKAMLHRGDEGEPVATILLPDED
jgi:hypothetical protein